MGLEQGLLRGLLGAVGGGAESVQEQEKSRREQDAKAQMQATEDAARTERELAIEQRKIEMRAKAQHEGLPDRLKEIEAEEKARARGQRAGAGINAALLKEDRDAKKDEAFSNLQELMQTPQEQRGADWNKLKSTAEKTYLKYGGSLDTLHGKRQMVTENDPLTGEPKTREIVSDGLYARSPQATPAQQPNKPSYIFKDGKLVPNP